MLNFHDVQNKVTIAIARLLEDDRIILARNASERAISHRLAFYLADQFPEWQVDVEYNRAGDAKKRLQNYQSCLKEVGLSLRRFSQSRVYPDIIVHHRAAVYNNLLVIEIKKSNSNRDPRFDLIKLQCLREELNYPCSLFLVLGVGGRVGEKHEKWFPDERE